VHDAGISPAVLATLRVTTAGILALAEMFDRHFHSCVLIDIRCDLWILGVPGAFPGGIRFRKVHQGLLVGKVHALKQRGVLHND
jgi:hypothetical protein